MTDQKQSPSLCLFERTKYQFELPVSATRFESPGIPMVYSDDGNQYRCEVTDCRVGCMIVRKDFKIVEVRTFDVDIRVLGGLNRGCISHELDQ